MAAGNVKKNAAGYGYKYTDLAQVNTYLESMGWSYYQYTQTEDGTDYIYTVPIIDGKEQPARRGCRIIQATLSGKSNPAQEQGSALTYARRYSLLMAFGLATTDDDAQMLDQPKKKKTTVKARSGKPLKSAYPEDETGDRLVDNLIEWGSKCGYDEAAICKLLHVDSLATLDDERLIKGADYFRMTYEERGTQE